MDDQWWFKALGQEFGPLRLADLVEAAHRGTLSPKDSVRHSERGQWHPAHSVEGLFSQHCEVELAADSWIVEVVGQTVGPLSIAEVATMIRERNLLPSHRIRRADSHDWQSVDRILDRLAASNLPLSATATTVDSSRRDSGNVTAALISAASVGSGQTPICDIEQLILEVLGAPTENQRKPSLSELGLAAQISNCVSEPQTQALDLQPSIADVGRITPATTAAVGWIRRNPFRRAAVPADDEVRVQEPAAVQIEDESNNAEKLILAPIKRIYSFRTVLSASVEHCAVSRPRRIPWLESLLLLGGLALLLQLFPAAGASVVSYADIRDWTLRQWVAAEVGVIVVLGGIVVWQRRRMAK